MKQKGDRDTRNAWATVSFEGSVGHIQKRLGTALRNLKVKYRGQKLSDGKTIGGGARRLTDSLINSLQNYSTTEELSGATKATWNK